MRDPTLAAIALSAPLPIAARRGAPGTRAGAVDTAVTYGVAGHKGEWAGTGGDVRMALSFIEKPMRKTPPGMVIEMLAHPGYDDADLRAVSIFTAWRACELEILSGAEFACGIERPGINLISFPELENQEKTVCRASS